MSDRNAHGRQGGRVKFGKKHFVLIRASDDKVYEADDCNNNDDIAASAAGNKAEDCHRANNDNEDDLTHDDDDDDDEVKESERLLQKTVDEGILDLENELYTFHPPRSYAHDMPELDNLFVEDNAASGEEADEGKPAATVSAPVDTPSPVGKDLPQARSQPRRARPRLKKKTPKMTDFFDRKSS